MQKKQCSIKHDKMLLYGIDLVEVLKNLVTERDDEGKELYRFTLCRSGLNPDPVQGMSH